MSYRLFIDTLVVDHIFLSIEMQTVGERERKRTLSQLEMSFLNVAFHILISVLNYSVTLFLGEIFTLNEEGERRKKPRKRDYVVLSPLSLPEMFTGC